MSKMSTWWLVFTSELSDVWVGGKGLVIILMYSIVLAVMAYIYSFDAELILIPTRESVYEILKNALAIIMFVVLVMGADTLSGERERNTLESLLLTPVSRRQIILGKFLGVVSFWPFAYAITIIFLNVQSQGDEVLTPAILWGLGIGTMMVFAFTALGMLFSFWSSSNRISYFASMSIYMLMLVPAVLPSENLSSAFGRFLQWIDPMASINYFLSRHLVNYEPVSMFWSRLVTPIVFTILSFGVLFFYAGPSLRLEPGKTNRPWTKKLAQAIGLPGLGVVLLVMLSTNLSSVLAQGQPLNELQISVDQDALVVKTGDKVEYNTLVSNYGSQASPPLIVAMNIVNLDAQGEAVDPEDWAPKRTQYVETLAATESTSLHWIINTIIDGNYMVYMVLIPKPLNPDSISREVSASGIHLTVTPYTRLSQEKVLPYTIGVPLLILVIIYFVILIRHRSIDVGAQDLPNSF